MEEKENTQRDVRLVEIPLATHSLVKVQAFITGRTVKDCVLEAARDWLKAQKAKGAK